MYSDFSCEGYKGVSQSAGHHIANNQIFKHVVGTSEDGKQGKYKINLLGEYNIGGDAFVIENLLESVAELLLWQHTAVIHLLSISRHRILLI